MMSNLIRNNTFIRQVYLLAGGTAVAQLINLIILPFLTRLYSPEDFGNFTVMTAASAILSVAVSLRYEHAIIAVRADSEALVGMFSVMVLSFIISVVLGVLWGLFSTFMSLSDKYFLIGYFAIVVSWVNSSIQALYFLCNRHSQYHLMTKGRVYAALSLAIVSLLWGVYKQSFWGLLLGSLAGLIVNLIYLWVASQNIINIKKQITFKDMYHHLKINSRFPKYLVPSSIVDRMGSQGYLILFTKLYGESVAGSLSLYNKVAGLPSVLVGSAIGDVFKRNASESLRKNGECRALMLKTIGVLFCIGIVPFIVLLVFAPFMFVFVFGDEWRQAGEFSRLLAPVFLLGFVVSPISSLIYLEENQKFDFYLQFVLLILLSIGIGLAYIYGDSYWAVIAFAISYSLKYIIELNICWKIASGKRVK